MFSLLFNFTLRYCAASMMRYISATKWPSGFDPDDTTAVLQCTFVNERMPLDKSVGQHKHATGQFAASLSGLVGLQMGQERLALPSASAVWVPPGIRHEGFLGEGAVSLYCHVYPEWAKLFPAEPYRLQLRPLTLALMEHFASSAPCYQLKSHEGRLAEVLCEELMMAPKLPLLFAPLPQHAGLLQIAEMLAAKPSITQSAGHWAQMLHMSERTLTRLSLKETGLTFGAWRMRLVMLAATDRLLKGLPVEQTAFELGYATPSAFSAAFRKALGVTPGEFRSRQAAGLARTRTPAAQESLGKEVTPSLLQ